MWHEDEVKEVQKSEISFIITPSKVNEKELFNYITHELSFDKVLSLYIMLRNAISTGELGGDE